MAIAGPEHGSHPVLIEITRTHLVWIQADTPELAREHAEKNPQDLLRAPQAVPVDASVDVAALTEAAAAWLDVEGEQYERLDRYFAAARTGNER
jgi:hypothetical protein